MEQFDSLHPWVEFEGVVVLPPESSLVIVARGVVDVTLNFLDSSREKVVVSLAKNFQEARELADHRSKGRSGSISGKLRSREKNGRLFRFWLT